MPGLTTPELGGMYDESAWRADAACRSVDPDLFYPIGETGPAFNQLQEAKAVCAGCAVREQCLNFALVNNEKDGVWGGTSEKERRSMHKTWLRIQRQEFRKTAS